MAAATQNVAGDGGLALLQKALGDERARNEQHKQNYEHLKSQHSKLQERCALLERQYQQSLEESQATQTKARSSLQILQKELRDRDAEIETLKATALTPDREELLRLKFAAEQEQPFAEKLYAVEMEAEKYRNEYNAVRYQLAVFQSEAEAEQKKSELTIEEQRLRFDAERNRLQMERDEAVDRCLKASEVEGEGKRALTRENLKLQNRLKTLTEELAEERSKREEVISKLEISNKKLIQDLGELKAKARNLESEKSSLVYQAKLNQEKAESASSSAAETQAKLFETEKRRETLAADKDALERDFKREMNVFQMEAVRLKGDHAKDKDALKNKISVLECQVEALREKAARQAEEAVEKERESERRVAEWREDEWRERQKREEERLKLERRLAEAKKAEDAEREKADAARAEAEEARLRLTAEERDAERRTLAVKKDAAEREKLEDELAAARRRIEDLNEKLVTLGKDNASLTLDVEKVEAEREKAASRAEMLKKEFEESAAKMAEFETGAERYAAKLRSSHEATEKTLSEKYDKVLKANHDIKKTADRNAALYDKQKQKSLKAIRHLKRSNELLRAELDELKALNENLGKNVSAETHFALKKKLKEMMKRHAEFQSLLMYAAPDATSAATLTMPSTFAVPPTLASMAPLGATVSDPAAPGANRRLGSEVLSERKARSAEGTNIQMAPTIDSRGLEDLQEVKQRAKRLEQLQSTQDKEIDLQLRLSSSVEEAPKAAKTHSSLSSISASNDGDLSAASLSEDKENF